MRADLECLTHHPLALVHSPMPSSNRQKVYVICGWQGCEQRRVVLVEEWEQLMREQQQRTCVGREPL